MKQQLRLHTFILAVSNLLALSNLHANDPNWSLGGVDNGWNRRSMVRAYFHNSELQRQWAWELLGKYRFTGAEKILDFGSGDGKISAELAHLVPDGFVHGVDLSDEMLRFARLKFPSYANPNLKFIKSNSLDFSDNPVGDNSGRYEYDLITAFCVFHFVTDYTTLLHNLRLHLKPTGSLLAVIPAGNCPVFYAAAEEVFALYGISCPWGINEVREGGGTNHAMRTTMRTLDGCKSIIEESGFTILTLKQIDTDTPFSGQQELIDWMVGTTTANWNIPREIAPAFFTDLVKRMHARDLDMVDDEGRWKFKMSRIHLVARPK